jgi:hypothetical protein
MIGNQTFKTQTTEPAVGEVEMHFMPNRRSERMPNE